MRGWQLAALSLGLRPNLGSLKQAPEALAAEYKVRRTAIRNAATPAAKKGKLQYEPDSIQSVIVIGKDKLTDLIFDAAKFLRFLKTTPAARVHVRFEEVVLQFQVGLSKKVPARNDNAAKSRIEGSLLDLVLGLAISHYDFVPSLAGIPDRNKSQKNVFEAISEDLAEHGIELSAHVVQQRLAAACERMAASDERDHFIEKYKAKDRR